MYDISKMDLSHMLFAILCVNDEIFHKKTIPIILLFDLKREKVVVLL